MRNYSYILIAILFITSLQACQTDTAKPLESGLLQTDMVNNPRDAKTDGDLDKLGKLVFEDCVHNFGKLKEGEIVQYDFSYTNVGKQAIVINDATTSCGCTVPDYNKQPIAVLEKGTIAIKFNSKGKHGMQDKDIFVITNGNPSSVHLKITAEVE